MASTKTGRLPVRYDIEQVIVIEDSRTEFERQNKNFSVERSLSGNTQHLVGSTFGAAFNKALLLHRTESSELTASQRQKRKRKEFKRKNYYKNQIRLNKLSKVFNLLLHWKGEKEGI